MFIEDDEILGYTESEKPVLFRDFRKDYFILERVKKFTVAGNSIRQRSRFMENVSFRGRLDVRCHG